MGWNTKPKSLVGEVLKRSFIFLEVNVSSGQFTVITFLPRELSNGGQDGSCQPAHANQLPDAKKKTINALNTGSVV